MSFKRILSNGAAAMTAALLLPGAAPADSLREALLQTYRTNPLITGERAGLRALDEGVAIARAGKRPQVSAIAGVNQDLITSSDGLGRNFTAALDVSYPLFTGGRVGNRIRAAEERVEAGRASLEDVEGDVFTLAVAAYMDVIRDRSVVALNRNQVRVLEVNFEATSDRFEIGDVTRTDVAQSEARLALAQSRLATAEGQLTASEEEYLRIVGSLPGDLEPPPPLPPLPDAPAEAVATALAENPELDAIAASIRAARRDVLVARADRLPTLDAVGSGNYQNFLGTADEQFAPGAPNSISSTGVGVSARIPIYQGGVVGAQVRRAQALESQLLERSIGLERSVIAEVRAAFASYEASSEAIESNEIAVAANQLALEGNRAELTVGTRDVLDVLNAEQELLESQVALVTARRDFYVAGFRLLNAMGLADREDLNLDGGYIYNPVENYERVAGKASDWSMDPRPEPQATRTGSVERDDAN
ncbi:MAG: TolC family outer membrane protein [Sphingomonadaceae bacterium]